MVRAWQRRGLIERFRGLDTHPLKGGGPSGIHSAINQLTMRPMRWPVPWRCLLQPARPPLRVGLLARQLRQKVAEVQAVPRVGLEARHVPGPARS